MDIRQLFSDCFNVQSNNRLPIYGNFWHFHDDGYHNLQSSSCQFANSFLAIDSSPIISTKLTYNIIITIILDCLNNRHKVRQMRNIQE